MIKIKVFTYRNAVGFEYVDIDNITTQEDVFKILRENPMKLNLDFQADRVYVNFLGEPENYIMSQEALDILKGLEKSEGDKLIMSEFPRDLHDPRIDTKIKIGSDFDFDKVEIQDIKPDSEFKDAIDKTYKEE